jgi:hypothetical protein
MSSSGSSPQIVRHVDIARLGQRGLFLIPELPALPGPGDAKMSMQQWSVGLMGRCQRCRKYSSSSIPDGNSLHSKQLVDSSNQWE